MLHTHTYASLHRKHSEKSGDSTDRVCERACELVQCVILQFVCIRDCVCVRVRIYLYIYVSVSVCVWPLEDHTLALLHPGIGSHELRVQKWIFTNTSLDPFHQPTKKDKRKERVVRSATGHTLYWTEGERVCVQQVDSLSDSDGRFLSVDCQLILKAFYFALHLWDVPLLHDATVVYTHKHTHTQIRDWKNTALLHRWLKLVFLLQLSQFQSAKEVKAADWSCSSSFLKREYFCCRLTTPHVTSALSHNSLRG